MIKRLFAAVLVVLAGIGSAAAQGTYPGNPPAGQLWFGQGASAPPAWATPAGDCYANASGIFSCQSLLGVFPGALFPLGIGGGLAASGGQLGISNSIVAGGPIGTASVVPQITYNKYGELTAVGSSLISIPFTQVTGSLTFSQFPSMSPDNIVGNFTGSPGAPGSGALTSCSSGSSAVTYNTSTHAFGCNSISGSGTAGYGITITSNVVAAPLIAYLSRPMFGGL